MADLALDIETVGPDWTEIDEPTREYMTARWERREITLESDEERSRQCAVELGLSRVVAVGMWNPATDNGCAWVVSPDGPIDGIEVQPSEAELLATVWPLLGRHRLVTFNGRTFDGPVLMVRSAQLGVPITRNLVPYRYDLSDHCDLMDVLTFWGTVRDVRGMDFWCRRFGVEGKGDVSGGDVAALYQAREFETIGRYVMDDARRTARLFCTLRDSGFLAAFKNGPRPVEQMEMAP